MESAVVDMSVKRLVKFENLGSLKAFCDLAVGEWFLIKGLRVVEGKNGLFVSMPRQQGKNGRWFDSVSVITKEIKKEVDQVVLEAYHSEPIGGEQEENGLGR